MLLLCPKKTPTKTESLRFWSCCFCQGARLYLNPVMQLSCLLCARKCRVLPCLSGLSLYLRWHLSQATRLNIIQPFKAARVGQNYAVCQLRVQTSDCLLRCWMTPGSSTDTVQRKLIYLIHARKLRTPTFGFRPVNNLHLLANPSSLINERK